MSDYISYKSGADFAGAEQLIQKEWAYIKENRPGFDQGNIKAVALSGGGIRSASFCLGVMQALANKDKLKHFDYLSTVSGGGYLGGALSWLWSGLWKEAGSQEKSFGVGKDDFPFGTEGRKFESVDQDVNRNQASLLRHLRQNGKYLTPGKGITALSFVSILLRSIVMGFITLIVLSGFVFSLFYVPGFFESGQAVSKFFWEAVTIFFGLYMLMHFTYMLFLSHQKKGNHSESGYRWRRRFESLLPVFLKLTIVAFLLMGIHWVQVTLDNKALQLGGGSALLGALLGSMGGDSKWRKMISVIPQQLQMILAATLMILGMLVLADYSANQLVDQFKNSYMLLTGGAAALILMLAHIMPINNISIHRYYRDRLMETFMPDAEKVFSGKDAREAIKANETGVHDLALGENKQAPYHLFNTNIILVESAIAKFRGRGGDNFLLSPLYSGSNATGWRNTKEYCGGKITIPSAVAISGAAANPDSGVAGRGLTTNVIVSILMSIFNLRLGYWASNPDPEHQKVQAKVPSYLKPGFWEVIKRNKMNETAQFVQLSDGGHFENLGLYELFRRRARLIIVCDAAADPGYEFGDLANAIEKARVDFGVKVNISREDLDLLVPDTKPAQSDMDYPVAKQSYIVADVNYSDDKKGVEPAKLIYIKTTLSENISADIHGYKRVNPAFPDETTIDQFFDEVQFEAYRELGWQIAQDMLSNKEVKKLL